MTSTFRLLIVSDIGGEETRHIGDEAMLEANLDAFRRLMPGVSITVVSRDPAWTAARYGVEAVAPFGFSRAAAARSERAALLEHLLADARRRATGNAANDSTIYPASDAVFRADALVVSGGGNLSSTWPDLFYERIALMQLAGIYEKPIVILGQTLGPRLEDDERRLLATVLRTARFVGLREIPSAALAKELGVPQERIWYQSDDAFSPEANDESVSISSPLTTLSARPCISVTIDPQIRAAGAALFDSLVSQLRQLSETTRASLIIIPHAFGQESATLSSDLTEARVLVERLGISGTCVAAGLDAGQARRVTGDAALIISSRYHPLVFGLAAGVPCLGIYGDDYCRIKLQGALTHAGLEHWTITYGDVARGELLTSALKLWHSRVEVRRQIESRREMWREESRARWIEILRALDFSAKPRQMGSEMIFGRPRSQVIPALVSALEARRQWLRYENESLEKRGARGNEGARHSGFSANEMGAKKALRRRLSAMRSRLRRAGL